MMLRSFKRIWTHHLAVQLATLSVLSATFAIVTFGLLISSNLQNALSRWGESIQVTAYLDESVDSAKTESLRNTLAAMPDVKEVEYIDKEKATQAFKTQMASYAPGLLGDGDFANPFPASFKLTLNKSSAVLTETLGLEHFAAKVHELGGIEDVSYGQNWVANYSAFVKVISRSAWVAITVLFFASLLIIANSVRAAVSARREEVEILELVGATAGMIRAPYILEGAFLGCVATLIALSANMVCFAWSSRMLQTSLNFLRLQESLHFFNMTQVLSIVCAGTVLGATGAYLTVRRVNDGWSAAGGIRQGAQN